MQELRINYQGMSIDLMSKDNKYYYHIGIKSPDANISIAQDDNGRPHVTIYFKQIARKKYFGLQEQIKNYINREVYTKYIDSELEHIGIKLDYSITTVWSFVQSRTIHNKRRVMYGTVEYKAVFTFDDDYQITATRLIDVKKSFSRAMKNYLDSLKPLSKKQYKVYSGIKFRKDYKQTKYLTVRPELRGLGKYVPF